MTQCLRYCYLLLLSGSIIACTKELSYEGGPPANGYLIKDALNNCSGISLQGQYFIGRGTTDSNYLQVQVHVTRAGQYTITSDKLNGYSFSAAGKLADTGTTSIKLKATGTPLATGNNIFKIRFDTSVCEVKITVADTVNIISVSNPDHFPLTDGSRWVYDDYTFPGDSIIRLVMGNTNVGNTYTYKGMDEYKSFYPATNRQYYTKVNNDYFRYSSVSNFTSSLNFDPSIYDDFNFLKEGLRSGQIWSSGTYTGRTSLGPQIFSLLYDFTCTSNNATITVNGNTFKNVYIIEMAAQIQNPGGNMHPSGELTTSWYAKGVGLIYSTHFNTVLTHDVMKIRSWLVN